MGGPLWRYGSVEWTIACLESAMSWPVCVGKQESLPRAARLVTEGKASAINRADIGERVMPTSSRAAGVNHAGAGPVT